MIDPVQRVTYIDLRGVETIVRGIQVTNVLSWITLRSSTLQNITQGYILIQKAKNSSVAAESAAFLEFPRLVSKLRLSVDGPLTNIKTQLGESELKVHIGGTQAQNVELNGLGLNFTGFDFKWNPPPTNPEYKSSLTSNATSTLCNIEIRGNPRFVKVSMPNLNQTGWIAIFQNPDLDTVELGLTAAHRVRLGINGPKTELSLTRLRTIDRRPYEDQVKVSYFNNYQGGYFGGLSLINLPAFGVHGRAFRPPNLHQQHHPCTPALAAWIY